jgi:hypothetical protein
MAYSWLIPNKGVYLRSAATKGQLEVLKWARDNGCDWNSDTCSSAARGGQLDLLKWLRDNGCDWDYKTAAYAAEGGHLDLLKWALGIGAEILDCNMCPCCFRRTIRSNKMVKKKWMSLG